VKDARRSLLQELKITLTACVAVVVMLVFSLTYRARRLQPSYAMRRKRGEDVRCLYALWHGDIWHIVPLMRGDGCHVLVSSHRDGEIIARILRFLGYGLIRGSSTRGGARALRDLARLVAEPGGDVAFTADGPRGPARELKDGVLYAASRTGLPIVPVGVWVDRAWHAGSWDSLTIGKPAARVAVVFGDEIHVPAGMSRGPSMEDWRTRVVEGMRLAESRARESVEGPPSRGAVEVA
jgi:lysophospholipid acyltransferase (LPLAT)-like uncharacterized protein